MASSSAKATLPPHEIHNTNLVSTFDVGAPLNVVAITTQSPCVFEYKGMSGIVNLASPRVTCLFYTSGKALVVGAPHRIAALLAAWKFVRLLHRHGYPKAQVHRFNCRNLTSTAYIGHYLDIIKIKRENNNVQLEIEYFPGAMMKIYPGRNLKISMFITGKLNIAGARNQKDTLDAYNKALPIMMGAVVRGKDAEQELIKRAERLRNQGKEKKRSGVKRQRTSPSSSSGGDGIQSLTT